METLSSGSKLTFVDTPGHALFDSMRSMAVSCPNIKSNDDSSDINSSFSSSPLLTDVVILIVAGDDGVRETTREVLNLLGYHDDDTATAQKNSNSVKLIVVVTKLDLPSTIDDQPEGERAKRASLEEDSSDESRENCYRRLHPLLN